MFSSNPSFMPIAFESPPSLPSSSFRSQPLPCSLASSAFPLSDDHPLPRYPCHAAGCSRLKHCRPPSGPEPSIVHCSGAGGPHSSVVCSRRVTAGYACCQFYLSCGHAASRRWRRTTGAARRTGGSATASVAAAAAAATVAAASAAAAAKADTTSAPTATAAQGT